jgi:hypothetical protein
MTRFTSSSLATAARDDIRLEVSNAARRAGQRQLAADLKGARCALWKKTGNLTERQKVRVAGSGSSTIGYRTRLTCSPSTLHPDLPSRSGPVVALLAA